MPSVKVADTVGAGDVLHGALARHLAGSRPTPESFAGALRAATAVASRACASFGTRAWMGEGPPGPTRPA